MTRLTRMFSLVLATSMLVLSAYSEAATIRYDVTNATSAQNGYSLSGYFEVSGTGNVGGFSSFSLTATKADNTTITISTGANTEIAGNVIATDSALYVPDGTYLSFYTSDYSQYIVWDNNYQAVLYYSTKNIDGDFGWDSSSYPITDENGWRIGSVQAVPEPSTYAMALAGLACGGYSMWRRRKRA